jgi:hypothetical protein
MRDLEDRLRAEVVRRSQDYEPSAELPVRIDSRVRQRYRRRQLAAGTLAVGVAAAFVLVVAVVASDRADEGSIRMGGQDNPMITAPPTTAETTSTSMETTTTTGGSPSGTTGTTGNPPEVSEDPLGAAIDIITPLSRAGIGPITVGMTLRAAQEAGGLTITPSEATGSGDTCTTAQLGDLGITLVVQLSGQAGEDVMNGIVRAVESVAAETEEGFRADGTRSDLVALYGQPTRIDDLSGTYGPGWEFLVFEAGGHAYGMTVTDELVLGRESGDPAWLSHTDGCP